MNMRSSYFITKDARESSVGADLIAWEQAERARLWAAEEAIYARINGRPVRQYPGEKHGAAINFEAGETKCGACRGLGILNYDAGFHDAQGVCDCPDCGGTGKRR